MSHVRRWGLDPGTIFLNHGSFGACPKPVLEYQHRLRERIERQPVQFFARDLESLLDDARAELATFLGADAQDLVWVPNATAAVNAVLRSLELRPDDELLTTDHEYNACRNVMDFVAERSGARVVVARVPFPLDSPEQVVDAVLDRATPRTRLALLDHVTSQTGLVLPIERLVHELAERGIDTLVDGAHAPGMLPLDVLAVGAPYYTGNCHKWLCAPKGAAFLYVRRDRQPEVRPIAISHGANSPRPDRSRYLVEFDWVGTVDPTAFLSVPEAIRFMGSVLPGGWPALRQRNREMTLDGRRAVCEALGIALPCPDEMIGSLASIPLPPGSGTSPTSPLYADPLQLELLDRWKIEVPVIPWPEPPRRLIRISAQLYNGPEQYDSLATALGELFRGPP
jgi:isopenicillin-N epimerase